MHGWLWGLRCTLMAVLVADTGVEILRRRRVARQTPHFGVTGRVWLEVKRRHHVQSQFERLGVARVAANVKVTKFGLQSAIDDDLLRDDLWELPVCSLLILVMREWPDILSWEDAHSQMMNDVCLTRRRRVAWTANPNDGRWTQESFLVAIALLCYPRVTTGDRYEEVVCDSFLSSHSSGIVGTRHAYGHDSANVAMQQLLNRLLSFTCCEVLPASPALLTR